MDNSINNCSLNIVKNWGYANTYIETMGVNDYDVEDEIDVMVAEPELEEPSMYAVVMFNDDYTPMEFVVWVLMSEFRHNEEAAVQIMLSIHQQGKGVAGIYTKEIAETKANKVNTISREEGFPLMTDIEPSKG